MISSLLVCSLCLQLAWTCVPMKPVEDLPCPTLPYQKDPTDYVTIPLTMTTAADGSLVYSCPDPYKLLSIDGTTATVIPTTTKLECKPNSGLNLKDGKPIGTEKYACGNENNCNVCRSKMLSAFIQVTVGFDDGTLVDDMKQDCFYKCSVGKSLEISGTNKPFMSVSCNKGSQQVIADMLGEELSMTNQFTCAACTCTADEIINKRQGLCPLQRVCTDPDDPSECGGTCPAKTKPYYQDKNRTPLSLETTSITCVGGKFIQTDYDDALGITCLYDVGEGVTPEPPEGTIDGKCSDLQEQQCPTPTGCDFMNIVYAVDGPGYVVMCKEGTLLTGDMDFELGMVKCQAGGGGAQWDHGITKATCITGVTPGVQKCLDSLTMLPATQIDLTCALGVCLINCKGAFQFEYTDENGIAMVKADQLTCDNDGGPLPIDPTAAPIEPFYPNIGTPGGLPTFPSLKCVPK